MSPGAFEGSADFNPAAATLQLTSAGESDTFLWKVSSTSGAVQTAQRVGGSLDDIATDIATGPDGSVSMVGHFMDTIEFDPDSSVEELTTDLRSVFAMQFASSGELLWARSPASDGGVSGSPRIVVDPRGNSWVTGVFTGTIDLDTQSLDSKGGSDVFVWALDQEGSGIEAYSAGGTGSDRSAGIALARDGGRLVLTGHFERNVDFDPGDGLLSLTSLPRAVPDVIINPTQDAFLWSFNTAYGTIVAANDEAETEEDTALEILVEDLLGNDSDVDSEELTLSVVGQPLHGTLEDQGDGTLLYTPDENYTAATSSRTSSPTATEPATWPPCSSR